MKNLVFLLEGRSEKEVLKGFLPRLRKFWGLLVGGQGVIVLKEGARAGIGRQARLRAWYSRECERSSRSGRTSFCPLH